MRSYCPHCQWDQQVTFKLKFDHIQTFYKEKGIWKCSQNVSHLFQYDIRRFIVISQILDGRDLNIAETNVKFHSDMGITKPHFSPQSRGFRNLRDSRSDASCHYRDAIMGAVASQITSLAIVYSTVYSGADQRKHQSSASLAFVRGIHRWPGQ